MHFTKMEGAGNDYLFINGLEETVSNPSLLARQMSRPHFGVGSDGIVIIGHSPVADFSMQIYNRDGSRGEMCGNASRCIGRYVYERGLTDKTEIDLMTDAGLRHLTLHVLNGVVQSVSMNMGSPVLDPQQIPVELPGETVLGHLLEVGGMTWRIHCVSMGNPHCVVFVRDPDSIDLPTIGPMLEHHPLFPKRTNVEFVTVASRDSIRMRVWERGSGETMACGTGACAAVVASVLTGQTDRRVDVHLPGGVLTVHWQSEDNTIVQEGPATFVFDGEWIEK